MYYRNISSLTSLFIKFTSISFSHSMTFYKKAIINHLFRVNSEVFDQNALNTIIIVEGSM